MLVRRNGRMCWSGNSLCLACMGITSGHPVSLTIIPKETVFGLNKSPIQQDIENNQSRQEMRVCKKCSEEKKMDPYFWIDRADIEKDKEYYCPDHS